jgi:hypothetical protein
VGVPFKLINFWQPILDPSVIFKNWRDVHVWAHIIGGVVWTILLHFLIVATPAIAFTIFGLKIAIPSILLVDFRYSPIRRLLGVAVIQYVLWERIQIENWRPTLMTPPLPATAGYPTWSALWDTIFATFGAFLFEGGIALLAAVV